MGKQRIVYVDWIVEFGRDPAEPIDPDREGADGLEVRLDDCTEAELLRRD